MIHLYRVPTPVLYGLKRSYFRFSSYKAIRTVLFLEILYERSYKGIVNATEFFQIFNKFSLEIFLNFLDSLMHLDLNEHSSLLMSFLMS